MGDEVIVNTAAPDLGLGSGGFDGAREPDPWLEGDGRAGVCDEPQLHVAPAIRLQPLEPELDAG